MVSAPSLFGPHAGVHALPSIELMGESRRVSLYEVIRPHIRRDTGQWLSKIPSGQQIVVELEQLSGSQEYIVQMNRWQPGSMGLTSHSPEGYPAAPSLVVRRESGLRGFVRVVPHWRVPSIFVVFPKGRKRKTHL